MSNSSVFCFAAPARVNPSSHKEIVTKVRNLYRKNSPYGCSQNVKAEVRDIDKAVEANRLREQRVDEYAQSELKKLNLVKDNRMLLEKSHTISARSPRHFENRPKLSSPKPKTADFQVRRRVSEGVNLHNASFRASSAAYSRRETKKIIFNPLKNHRIASLDAIMKCCDDFKPTLKPNIDLIENCQVELTNSTKTVKDFIEDMEDCMKLNSNQSKLKGMANEGNRGKRYSRVMSVEPGIKDEMLTVTRKLAQFGGYKVWRHNHAEFMSSAEKIINSIPKLRS